MKSLKYILTLTLILSTTVMFAKNITTKIKVKGQCGMCKTKIEKALDVKGISFAEWDKKTKILRVRYNDSKITEDKIHEIISNLGYATDKLAADKTAESKLDKCCRPKDKKKGDACCSK